MSSYFALLVKRARRIIATPLRKPSMPASIGKPTIYDIARLSGASPSTVSAVLSGKSTQRRIKESTQAHILAIAARSGYSPNLQARGLRSARSGLAGMIIPLHENRFFASLSQSFDTRARARGLCPVIASTLRNPTEEARVVETLISYKVDTLFIAGATDPDALGAICAAAKLQHVFIDLPGCTAPSVVTHNTHGAELLTRRLLRDIKPSAHAPRARPYFLGGNAADNATTLRVKAFRAVARQLGVAAADAQILLCGYAPRNATLAIEAVHKRLGGLPAAIFVNSLTVFEGVMSHFVKLPPEAFNDCAIGCYDYDPLAGYLQFPVTMVRQNTDLLIDKGYELLDAAVTGPLLVEIEPDLIEPRTFYQGPVSDLG